MSEQKYEFLAAENAKQGAESTEIGLVQEFLSKYGYFQSSDFKLSRKFNEPMVEALRLYQHFHGLEITGELDNPTLTEMSKPRCGFPDFPESADYQLDGRKWSHKRLTYKIINFSPDLAQSDQKKSIAQAFGLWEKACGLTFTETNDAADIEIKFVSANHGDGSAFDGPGGVLAHAFFPPPNGGQLAGDAHFDEAEKWAEKIPLPPATIDLTTVAAHEFGHSIGLRHSRIRGALMFPSYSGPHRFLDTDDINGAQALYGKKV